MNKILITLLFAGILFTGSDAQELNAENNSLLMETVEKKLKPPTKVPEIIRPKIKIVDNELIINWSVKEKGDIVTFAVEKITEHETKIAGEVKTDKKFVDNYFFTDKLTPEDLDHEVIIYRIRGLDSAGQLITQKQLPFETEKEFKGYDLFQNYPNPFNPVTTIKYQIPSQDLVVVKVFNILGNQLTVLVDEMQPAGTHEVEFNGAELTSGVYMYTIQAGKYTQTKRMILMK